MNTEKLKAVLDTNIFISAVLFGGNPGEVYRMGIKGLFDLVVSADILQEVEECLVQKFLWEPNKSQAFVSQIKRVATVINVQEQVPEVCRDPQDDHVLAAALQEEADYIVSGDKDLLELRSYMGVKIVDAAAFIEITAGTSG